ncbi:unnamed protein product [Rotaria sp. Silwood1]|nr:unnamed protein product [Rotaria sp. Silwood1]
MSETKSKQNNTTSLTTMRRRRRMAENYIVIWVDGNIDLENEDCQNTLVQLRDIANDIIICTEMTQCIIFLNDIDDEKAFVISSGAVGQHLMPDIHDMPQIDAIYIFSGNKQRYEAWSKNWTKIQGVYTTITPICDALKIAIQKFNQHNISISIIGVNEESSSENLNQLEPSFMYSQIFKEILLNMEYGQEAIRDFVMFCQEEYQGNTIELKLIDKFQRTYHPTMAIWWYTCECFIYKMLNHALRTLDGDIIIRMGFYLCDVHRKIISLYNNQISQYHSKLFLVYRGQVLSTADFKKLTKNKNGLISFNNFLSTSKNRNVSLRFVMDDLEGTNMVGILFQMTIDSTVSSIPFASIQEESYYKKEDEILFSMHTVFRIGDIRKLDNNRPLYQVDLKLTSDDDQQLRQLTERIRQETAGGTGWHQLGELLLKIGQFNKAEELYTALLEQTSNDSDRAFIYHQLAYVKKNRGEYKEAVSFYEKDLKIMNKVLPPNHLDLAASYSNIGGVYQDMGEYSKALEFYETSHRIKEMVLPSNHPDVAASYNNIGLAYNHMGDYWKALEYYEKSHKIFQQTLPLNHPDLATFYNNIGSTYHNMGNYTAALKAVQNALNIRQRTFQEDNAVFAFTYGSFGRIYCSMKDYSRTLDYFEKCFTIDQKTLPERHPNRALTYSNIGDVHRLMGNYQKALFFHQKALNIQENVQCNPLECAKTYKNLGETYREMKCYSTALIYYQKGLKICENKLPKNHPDLSVIYHNLATLYLATCQYNLAMKNVLRAIEIAQEKLPSTHPDLLDYKETLEKIRNL